MPAIIKKIAKNYLQKKGWAPLPARLSAQGQKSQQLIEAVKLFNESTSHADLKQITFDRQGPVVELADGRRYLLDLSTKAGSMWTVPFTGNFEPDETAFVRQHVKPGDTAIDVGANFGWFTMLLSQLVKNNEGLSHGPNQGQVHAFEPVVETADLLERNVQLNNADNIHVSTAALDAQDAMRDLYVPDIGISGSFALHHYDKNYQVQQVHTMTLDTYVKQHSLSRVDFIKADIEGAELNMLKGATDTLTRFRPTLLLEVQASSTRLFGHEPAEVHAFLKAHGYECSVLESGGNTRALAGEEAPESAYNFVFSHREKALQSTKAAA